MLPKGGGTIRMDGKTLQILIAMVIYMAVVIVIGVLFAKRANPTVFERDKSKYPRFTTHTETYSAKSQGSFCFFLTIRLYPRGNKSDSVKIMQYKVIIIFYSFLFPHTTMRFHNYNTKPFKNQM